MLALGGGAVLREENRLAIRGGQVFWLRASVETIERRIAADVATAQRRPNLTLAGGPSRDSRAACQTENRSIEPAPDYEIDTEGKTPDEVAGEIAALVRLDNMTP